METEAASRWVNAAKVRGVEAKALNMGFITLSKSIVGATEEGSKQAKMFEDLGVSQEAIKNGDTEAVLMGVSDAFAKMPDNAQKAALAQKLFGRQSQTLLPLINKGSDALQEQLALSDKYGTTMSQDQVDAALKAAAAQREWNLALDGLRILFGTSVMPALTSFVTGATGVVSQLRSGEGDIGRFGRSVVDVFKDIAGIVGPIATTVADGFSSLSAPLKKVAIAAAGFGAIFLATGPIGLGIAAVVGGAVLIKRNWETIGPIFDQVAGAVGVAFGSVKEWVADAIGNVKRWLDLGSGDLQQFGRAASNFGGMVRDGLRIVGGAFKWAFETIALPIVKRVLPAIQQYVQGALGVIGGIVKIFSGIFTGDFRKMWEGVKQLFSGYLRMVIGVFRAGTAPLRAAVAAMARGIWSAIRGVGSAVYSAGKWVLGRLIDAVKAYYTPAFAVGKFVSEKVVAGIKNISGKIAGAGKWIVSRVGDGIRAAVSGLASIGKTIATTIINAVKSALGIKSPSVVFQQIGKFMVQGLARGIKPGNVRSVLGKAFGGTSKFVKAMVKKGFASVGSLPGKLASMLGLGGGGESSANGLTAQVKRALSYARKHGWKGGVNSGFRSSEQQAILYQKYLDGTGNLAAPPGSSSHEKGQAVDVSDSEGFARAMATAPAGARLYRRVQGEPWHFSVTGYARGGKVMQPSYVVGEEAPRFPEYILSTNPRDRDRSTSLWMEAAGDLGIDMFKKGGKKKKKLTPAQRTARRTARSVRGFNNRTDRQDALDAAYDNPKYNVNLQKRLAEIDKLLRLKKMAREDRNALLNMRGQIQQELASGASESDGEEGNAELQAMISAIDANTQAQRDTGEELRKNREYAKQVGTATRSITQQSTADMISETLGGHLASMMLTLSARYAH